MVRTVSGTVYWLPKLMLVVTKLQYLYLSYHVSLNLDLLICKMETTLQICFKIYRQHM